MKILERDAYWARCEAKGIERSVSLMLLDVQDVEVGDHVLVHVGYAIQKLSAEDARSTWALLDELLEHERMTRPVSVGTDSKMGSGDA